MSIPAEFRMPDFTLANALGKGAWEPTAYPGVQKPVAGSVGPLYAEFRVHEEYSGADSVRLNKEVKRPVEICVIKTDRFSAVPLRVGKLPTAEDPRMIRSEMTRKQEMDLAPLYERFRSQKDSTDTSVFTWDAVTDMERGHLGSLGIYTVEQLFHTPKDSRYRFGPGGEELWERAARFMRSKKENDPTERAKELEMVREERDRQNLRLEMLEKQLAEMQIQKALKAAPRTLSAPKTGVGFVPRERSLSDQALEKAQENLKGSSEE